METNLKDPNLNPSQEMRWSHAKVLALISSVEELFEDFYDTSVKKKHIWSRVAKQMLEKGYTCNGLACDKKWRNLKGTYINVLQKQLQGDTNSRFEYFDAMHHILGQEIGSDDLNEQSTNQEKEPDATDAAEFKDLTDDDGFHWDDQEVNLLLDCITECKKAFAVPNADLDNVWEDIAGQMSHVGEEVTSEQCQRKWLSLEEGFRVHQAQAEATGVVPLWAHYTRTGEVAEAVSVRTTFQIQKKIRVKSQQELRSKSSPRNVSPAKTVHKSSLKDASSAKTLHKSSQRNSSPSKAARPRVGREQGVLARVKHIESSLSVRQRLERLEARVEASRQQRETTRRTNALLAQVLAELRRINGALKQDSSMGKVQVMQGQSSDPGSCSPKNQEFIIVEAYTDPL
ncbi:uncharacterized protein LOC126999428 [Eriocheir sinensis]|uniref:uncharacterized protein LOC126999428 n=1 Tax=Eriocheir sinensis TaxID=95602 RepID=UPI0021C5F5AC|nr:uncharacterized protein LOC126999428 [Eriocheir sinensis]XP_050717971.1 uncharacterized protein LOC126999428 [Eriocheir sinensis]